MSDLTHDITIGALITGVIGIAATAITGMFKRNVKDFDTRFEHLDQRVKELESAQERHSSTLMELRGTVNSESWGLVAVVGKLSTNVEKLTSAVDRMDALVHDKRRGEG